MPIFEFVCKRCNKQFEELVFSQDEQTVCPSCGSTNTEKLMSCCRSKVGSGAGGREHEATAAPAAAPSGGGCAGCSGGSCSSCH
jgi:putative regulatory protein, FmdB family